MFDFVSLAVETFGGWSAVAIHQIQRLGRALSSQGGKEEGEATAHLFQKLSVLLQKDNAALLLNRIPSFPSHIDEPF